MSSIASDLDEELFGPRLDLSSRPTAASAPAGASRPAASSSLSAVPGGGESYRVTRESSQGKLVGLIRVVEGPGVDICGGRVKSKHGEWFCIRGPDCSTESHKKKAEGVQANHLYVCSEVGTKASVDQGVPIKWLGEEADDWMEEQKHPVEWKLLFDKVRASKPAPIEVVTVKEDDDSEEGPELIKASRVLFAENEVGGVRITATPFRQVRGGPALDAEESPSWEQINKPFSPIEFEELEDEPDESESQKTWGEVADKLNKKLKAIHQNQTKMSDFYDGNNERIHLGLAELSSAQLQFNDKQSILQSLIGEKPKSFNGEEDIVGVWDGVEVVRDETSAGMKLMMEINEEVKKCSERLELYEAMKHPMNGEVQELQNKLNKFQASSANFRARVGAEFKAVKVALQPFLQRNNGKSWMERITDLEDNAVSNVGDEFDWINDEGRNGTSEDVQMENLKQEFTSMKELMGEVRSQNEELKRRVTTLEEIKNSEHGYTSSDKFYEAFDQRIKEIEASLNSRTITVSGESFGGVADCAAFIKMHMPGAYFDKLYDMVSLLHRTDEESATVKDSMSHEDHVAKAGHASRSAAVIVSSMGTVFPAALGSKTKSTRENPIPSISSVELFGLNTKDGIRDQINKRNKSNVDEIMSSIKSDIPIGPGQYVCQALLVDAVSHWKEIESFLQNNYNNLVVDLTGESSAIKKKQWTHCLRVVKRVFEVLKEERSVGADLPLYSSLSTEGKKLTYSAKIMWASLKCHQFMNELMTVGLANHDIAVAETSAHLVESWVHPSTISNMSASLKKLDGRVQKLEKK